MIDDLMRQRVRVLSGFVLGAFVLLFARLAWVHVLGAEANLRRMATGGVSYSVAARGTITDVNGVKLALSVAEQSVAANALRILPEKRQRTAERLAPVLGLPEAELLAKLQQRSGLVWLARAISPAQADAVRRLRLDHITLETQYRRVYPYDDLGAHLLGFVSGDDRGLEGMELWGDRWLRYHAEDNPEPARVTLTIDHLTQHIATEELGSSCEKYGARGGTVVVLDVRSGDVLAMASWPTFDPNRYGDYLDTASRPRLRNRTITDVFEPGSIFKIFDAAALLEKRAVDLNRRFFCPGYISRAGRTIHCVHNHGDQTFADVLANSCNVGMVEAIDGIQPRDLYAVLRDFGFGLPTGIELRGEVGGALYRPERWSGQSRHSLAIGYEIMVTPLQMATAAAAIANGGVLLRPRLVRAVTTRDGTVLHRGQRQEVRRVVSYGTTRTLLRMMRGVVERGSGRAAAVNGFSVAGKTGTARLPNLETGGYYDNRWIGSFIGVAPADDPKLAILVSITDPTREGYYGGTVAAPVFRDVAQRILAQLGISAPGTLADIGGTSGIARSSAYDGKPGIMPDLRGLTLADVIRLLGSDFPRARIEGSGLVVEQRPAAGTSVWDGELYVRLQ